jgi:hypothetical protein
MMQFYGRGGTAARWLISGEGMMLKDKEFLELSADWQHSDIAGRKLIKSVAVESADFFC